MKSVSFLEVRIEDEEAQLVFVFHPLDVGFPNTLHAFFDCFRDPSEKRILSLNKSCKFEDKATRENHVRYLVERILAPLIALQK